MLTKNSFLFLAAILLITSCKKDDNDPKEIIQEPVLVQWYVDGDTDGFGNPDSNLGKMAATKPDGFVSDNSDCDDNDASINPQAEEDNYDGVDSNCDNHEETIISTFSKTLSYGEDKFANFLFTSLDGDYLSVGTAVSSQPENSTNKRDFWVVKFNLEGTKIWEKFYGGPKDETLWSAKQTLDGGLILCGVSESDVGNIVNSAITKDWWILKLNETGDIQWEKTMGGSRADSAYDIIESKEGGYLVVGSSSSNDGDFVQSGSDNTWFVKLDNDGNVEWQTSADEGVAKKTLELEDGTFLVVGDIFTSSVINEISLIKLTSTGQVLWTKNIPLDASNASPNQILLDSNQNVLVSGVVYQNNQYEGLLLNLTQAGEINWMKFINDSNLLNTIKTTVIDDFYLVTATMRNINSNNTLDVWLGKYDFDGNQLWTKFYGGNSSEFHGGLIQTADSGFLMSATTRSVDGDIVDRNENDDSLALWLFKLKPNFKF